MISLIIDLPFCWIIDVGYVVEFVTDSGESDILFTSYLQEKVAPACRLDCSHRFWLSLSFSWVAQVGNKICYFI